MERAALKAKIYGRVQGVGFRYFTLRRAREYHITGYVKNLGDRTVEAYAEGRKDVLKIFLTELKKGPFGANVEKVQVVWLPESRLYDDFIIT